MKEPLFVLGRRARIERGGRGREPVIRFLGAEAALILARYSPGFSRGDATDAFLESLSGLGASPAAPRPPVKVQEAAIVLLQERWQREWAALAVEAARLAPAAETLVDRALMLGMKAERLYLAPVVEARVRASSRGRDAVNVRHDDTKAERVARDAFIKDRDSTLCEESPLMTAEARANMIAEELLAEGYSEGASPRNVRKVLTGW